MAEIDDRIRQVMSEMAKRRWAKSTPEERRAFGMFLVNSRKKKKGGDVSAGHLRSVGFAQDAVDSPASGSRPEPMARQQSEFHVSEHGPEGSDGTVDLVKLGRENSLCFRCRSGYHARCLGPSCGCGCVEKPEWS